MKDEIEQQIIARNRQKLKQQNLKLYSELKHLQSQIDAWQEQQQRELPIDLTLAGLQSEIDSQKREMRQLRQQVEVGRQGNLKQNVIYIQKEENELLYVKQELQKLQEERELLSQSHQDKLKKLEGNRPLQQHKESMQSQWAETKRANRETALKIVEIEREIRKYHSLKERGKDSKDVLPNQEVQLQSMEAELARMNAEMKSCEAKWKPTADALDNQFFHLRGVLESVGKEEEELRKDEGEWRVRAAAVRDSRQIEMDRNRLSKLQFSVHEVKKQPLIKKKVGVSDVIKTRVLEEGNNNNKQSVLIQDNKSITGSKTQIELKKTVQLANKNIKLNDLIRAESSSNYPANKKPARVEIAPKIIESPRFKSKDQKVDNPRLSSPNSSPTNKPNKNPIIIPTEKHLSSKNNKRNESQTKKTSTQHQQIHTPNCNDSNWMNRRQKQKVKSSNLSSDLAEQIRRKAEQVKKINQKMESVQAKPKQTERQKTPLVQLSRSKERSVSSHKKLREKEMIKQTRTGSASIVDNKIQSSKFTSKKNIGTLDNPHRNNAGTTNNMATPKANMADNKIANTIQNGQFISAKKDLSISNQGTPSKTIERVKSQIKPIQPKTTNPIFKTPEHKQKLPKSRDKELVQQVDIRSDKDKEKMPKNHSSQQISNKEIHATPKEKISAPPKITAKQVESTIETGSKQISNKRIDEKKEKSPKQQKPKLDIFMIDPPKRQNSPIKPKPQQTTKQKTVQQDETQGIPKRVIRRRVNQNSVSTTGTST